MRLGSAQSVSLQDAARLPYVYYRGIRVVCDDSGNITLHTLKGADKDDLALGDQLKFPASVLLSDDAGEYDLFLFFS